MDLTKAFNQKDRSRSTVSEYEEILHPNEVPDRDTTLTSSIAEEPFSWSKSGFVKWFTNFDE
jgi:hypothetical protein